MANNPNAQDNLTSWKPGESGNPAGKPKGTKHLSTIVQELLADEELLKKLINPKTKEYAALPTKNAANAIAMAMISKAMSGDKQAADWVRKSGYGDKLTVENQVEVQTFADIAKQASEEMPPLEIENKPKKVKSKAKNARNTGKQKTNSGSGKRTKKVS